MKFHVGAIPLSPDFSPDETWHSFREPSPWLMQLLALPIGFATALLVVLLWGLATPIRIPESSLSVATFILYSFAGLVIVHELIHAAVHPMSGRTPRSILGFWPSRLLFYAHYDGELSRNRFVLILLTPLAIISFLPLIPAALFQWDSGWLAFVSALNALMACGDVFGAGLLLFQVPTTAIVRNQGWKTYWREPA